MLHEESIPESLLDLTDCALCPRRCGARRTEGELGYCRTGASFSVGSICVHRGEEPVVSGPHGICNVFFTRCNMQCLYCQNHQISRNDGPIVERELAPDEVIGRVERILDGGVRCVGFVSPSHCIPQMVAVIRGLRRRGRAPTFIMNTNAYDRAETLRALEGIVDVYLPDLKYMDAGLAARWSDAPGYVEAATQALKEMYRQKGPDIRVADDGYIQSGLIVRHLVLPGQVANSRRCLEFIAEELSPSVHVSLMAQYVPTPAVAGHPELGRRLRPEEYEEVLEELERLGFENGWTQELASADAYQPDFAQTHPFE
jgi:putative pyruvate formate lyase activating enzyme